MQNVHSSMSYWQQNKTKKQLKQMDRYAFTEGTVSLDTIRRELIFSCRFSSKGLTIVQS